jgi:hypothetical protein
METSENQDQEGWFTDPFGRHEARWLSNGTPTKLVRDGEKESYDDPPAEEPSRTPERIEAGEGLVEGQDLLRADEPGSGGSLQERMAEAAEFGATGGADIAMPGRGENQ